MAAPERAERLQHRQIDEHRRRDAERDHVRQRVELHAELAGGVEHARQLARRRGRTAPRRTGGRRRARTAPRAAATMPKKPNAMLARVTAFGMRCFACTADVCYRNSARQVASREDRARLSAHLRPDRAVPGGADAHRLSARATASRCCRSTPTSRPTIALLRPEPLARAARARRGAARASSSGAASLDHAGAARLPAAVARARRRAGRARRHRRGARGAQGSRRASSTPSDYERAVETIESALRLISAAHAPLDLDFTGYRTPFALTTPDEIAARRARRARSVRRLRGATMLAPRLRDARVDAIGIVGLLSRAAAAGLRLRAQAQAAAARGAPHRRRAGHHAAAHPPARARSGARARAVRQRGGVRGRARAARPVPRARREARRCAGCPTWCIAIRCSAPVRAGPRRRRSARAAGARLRRAAARPLLLAAR